LNKVVKIAIYGKMQAVRLFVLTRCKMFVKINHGFLNMPSKTWKSRELKVAKFFNTQRNPLSGGNSKHTRSDTLHNELYVECKHRQKHAIYQLWKDTAAKAKTEDKTPICAISQHGEKGFLIVVHCDDFEKVIDIVKDQV
jgi:hypothetical protein